MKLPTVALIALPIASFACTALLVKSMIHRDHRGSITSVTIYDSNDHVAEDRKQDFRNVAAFRKIHAGGAMEISTTIGDKQSVQVDAPAKYLKQIKTDVKADTLFLSTEGDISLRSPIKITIVVTSLEAINLSGASEMTIEKLNAKEFRAEASGGSKLKVQGRASLIVAAITGASSLEWPEIDTKSVDFTLSGGSTVDVDGKTATVKYLAEGASILNGNSLLAEKADVTASGASTVQVNAHETLAARASGASNIKYSGDVSKVTSEATGASSIEKE